MKHVRITMVGVGKIALANHLPGVAMSGRASVVALCDSDPVALAHAARQTGIARTFDDYRQAVNDPETDALIVATPNHTHLPIVLAAVAAGKHVLCEKPLALDLAGAIEMYRSAERAGVRHMTAFTYRFVPAMRYMAHLVQSGAIGTPIHFRAQRFQDWGDRPLGWRQRKSLAGSGEMADMLSHRIDYAHLLVGPMRSIVADLRTFIPTRGGEPSDVDDWVAVIAQFQCGATGVLESTKLAAGVGEGYGGRDVVEINGTEATIVYSTQTPLELRIARRSAADLDTVAVPGEFLVWPGSGRDPGVGDPRVTFRYDQSIEFIDAILSNRSCRPSFVEGVHVQAVMESALESARSQKWVDVNYAV